MLGRLEYWKRSSWWPIRHYGFGTTYLIPSSPSFCFLWLLMAAITLPVVNEVNKTSHHTIKND